jgi:hypothetical protein
MIKLFLLPILWFMATLANASCNFVSADYLSEIGSPKSIKTIQIDVPKSAKFNRNFAKILVSRSKNIPKNLKKYFRATVVVNFDFGSCTYKAKVRQNGDLRDHIKLVNNGEPQRSLVVKLDEGNVLSAVKFKLLIPETRNNLNEVLGTIFLNKLGFITPETFQVETIVNGTRSLMLFQEDTRKELLERNNRREGPMFEGDETLIWSGEHKEKLGAGHRLKPISLARVSNIKWFLKGETSQEITLTAFNQLQMAYLDFSQNWLSEHMTIFPNQQNSPIFEDYFFSLLMMSGLHAGATYNRKFYFNTFTDEFEPIYYDGLFLLTEPPYIHPKKYVISSALRKGYKFPFENLFSDTTDWRAEALEEFRSRVVISDTDALIFFEKSITQMAENIDILHNHLQAVEYPIKSVKSTSENIKSYVSNEIDLGLVQRKIIDVPGFDEGYDVLYHAGDTKRLTSLQLGEVLSRNILNDERTVLLPSETIDIGSRVIDIDEDFKNLGQISHSEGLLLQINNDKKIITAKQVKSNDWLLVSSADLTGWELIFEGIKSDDPGFDIFQPQRFNDYGLTGCLNIYGSKLDKVKINVQGGKCEDGINIISSNGSLNSISIKNAFADAIDIDFSNITIEFVNVNVSGNDCADLSGGTYSFSDVKLSMCGDKGISIGEKSTFIANKVEVNGAYIGVSSKDYSETVIRSAKLVDTEFCYEASKKKQEFGGAKLLFDSLSCKGNVLTDKHSTITVGARLQ